MSDILRVVELFAGVGGFRIGLEEASEGRFKTVWADQWEPGSDKRQFAFRCYDGHFTGTGSVNVNKDIDTVWREVPEHDLLVGGFPCQDYSVASTNAKGIEGKKGVLWWNINDIIKLRRPRYVILENVDRLLKSPVNQRGRDFGIILRCFADEGYYVEWRVINAADYGLQQRRRRTFIFATRDDTAFAQNLLESDAEEIVTEDGFFAVPFPVKHNVFADKLKQISIDRTRYPDLVSISNNFRSPLYNTGVMRGYSIYTRETEPSYTGEYRTLRDILVDDADKKYYLIGDDLKKWEYMKGPKKLNRKHKDGTPYVYSEGGIPFPDILDRAGRTMLTSEGSPNRSSHIIKDPVTGGFRTLTPMECERLNGFPDDWTEGYMTERQRYFTMGNALVVQLIERMGERLLSIVDDDPDA